MELSERKKKILASVVERYILTGEPVGSKVLCGSLSVSSATVRNEMADLSEMGLLEQPHTSAGRIPSHRGIRYYIDNLMTRYAINNFDRFTIESKFGNAAGEPEEILSRAMTVLSDMTGLAAVSSTPYDPNAVIRRVELVPLSSRTVLIVLLVSTGVIKNRICRCESDVNIEIAELFYNIAGAHFINHRADELTVPKIQSLAASLGDRALTMTPLLVTLSELAHDASKRDVLVDGKAKLLSYKELESDMYELLDFLKKPQFLSEIIDSGSDKLCVSIGRENMNRCFENASIVSYKYTVGGKNVGSIGVIGPVRMDYTRIIPDIAFTSEKVGQILSEAIDK
ncbi:MAG: heat-inducible transcriptional repressor HrcA [Clostridiales bacterium]|nr:heat-inducible transcriptional repressor HrcA [Clostridiales bacterium]